MLFPYCRREISRNVAASSIRKVQNATTTHSSAHQRDFTALILSTDSTADLRQATTADLMRLALNYRRMQGDDSAHSRRIYSNVSTS
jgi:hypothetical protein